MKIALASALLLASQMAHAAIEPPVLTLPRADSSGWFGSQLRTNESLLPADLRSRESQVRGLVMDGNVPHFLRTLCPVNVTNVVAGKTNTGTFFVTPDYLALGTDADHLLMPIAPETAQRIADSLVCVLPTRKMVDAIYDAAALKLTPQPIPPTPAMTSLPVFLQHNEIVRTQRVAMLQSHPLGTLVAGHKKDVVISAKLDEKTTKVAIYGWHRTNDAPIQPLYTGHGAGWVDYSHGIRLVSHLMYVNGEARNVASVLADPKLCALISDEGVVTNSRYPTTFLRHHPYFTGMKSWPEDFIESPEFNERVSESRVNLGIRVLINAPPPENFAPDKTVRMIFYALPNGNTIEQTAGKKLSPGDDWHFDIQHIAAQTRFLRGVLTNETLVVVYLENDLKSWPAWRRRHGNSLIPGLIEDIKQIFRGYPVRTVLTGHSGGGSLTFGYLEWAGGVRGDVDRIAFLDSNYAYETTNHFSKLSDWLKRSPSNHLCVLAYDDANALLEGKPFVSARGGTWGRSHAMLEDFGSRFQFTSLTNGALRTCSASDGRIRLLLLENPDRKILHTVQVERNGFIHAMLMGTPWEDRGYDYMGARAYTNWISTK